MEAFIEKFSRKYNLPLRSAGGSWNGWSDGLSGRANVVREGERNSDFYVVSRGIWLGRYCNDGADVSVWFAGEGEALFSTWGYVGNAPSQITIEAMCDAELYGIAKADLEVFRLVGRGGQLPDGGSSRSSLWRLKTGFFRVGPRGPRSVTGR